MLGTISICWLSGRWPVGGVLSIAGIWQVAPAAMKAFTTADPSAPVPPVTTICRSLSDCISTPQSGRESGKQTEAGNQASSFFLILLPRLRGRIQEGESRNDDLSTNEINPICNYPSPNLWPAPSCILPRMTGEEEERSSREDYRLSLPPICGRRAGESLQTTWNSWRNSSAMRGSLGAVAGVQAVVSDSTWSFRQ